MACSLVWVYFIGDFCKLNKTPSDGTCLGEPPGGFCDVGCCCCFYLIGDFYISGLSSLPTALQPSFSGREGGHQLWALPWLLLVALPLPGFSVTVLPRALRFLLGILYQQGFFTLGSLPTFLACFVTQVKAGTPHPGSSSVPTLTELSLPAEVLAWTTHILVTRPLIYQLCHWAMKYRVKIKLLNIKIHFEQYLDMYCI